MQSLAPAGRVGGKGHCTLELVDNVLICGFVLQENTWQITNKISCKDLEEPCPGELLYEKRVLIWFDENQPISIYTWGPATGRSWLSAVISHTQFYDDQSYSIYF